MPRKRKKAKTGVNVGITIQHHDYYGEEVDPGLAAILRPDRNTENESLDAIVRSDESYHVTTTAEEVVNTTQVARANRTKIELEDIKNDHEGVNVDVTLQHHNTTRVTRLNPAEIPPVHVGNVEDAVNDGSRANYGSVY